MTYVSTASCHLLSTAFTTLKNTPMYVLLHTYEKWRLVHYVLYGTVSTGKNKTSERFSHAYHSSTESSHHHHHPQSSHHYYFFFSWGTVCELLLSALLHFQTRCWGGGGSKNFRCQASLLSISGTLFGKKKKNRDRFLPHLAVFCLEAILWATHRTQSVCRVSRIIL